MFPIGSPPPVVIWKNNDGKIIDDSYEFLNTDDNHTRNRLEITQIDRNYLLKEIICEAYPPSFISKSSSLSSSFSTNKSHEFKIVSDSVTNTTAVTTTTTAMNTSKSYFGNHHTNLDIQNKIIHNNNNNNRNNNRHIHHHSFVRRTSVLLDLNCKSIFIYFFYLLLLLVYIVAYLSMVCILFW